MKLGKEQPAPAVAQAVWLQFPKKLQQQVFTHAIANQKPLERSRTTLEGPFGEVLRATGPMAKANPFRFSTKYQDDETDLLYYSPGRYYVSSVGRWASRDPIEEEGGLNLYGFLGNNPLSDVDAFGLCGCKCKSVKITFNPGGDNMQIGFYAGPGGEEFGSVITIAWTVEGDPTKCKYFLNELAGGVTGSGPSGKFSPSDGTFGQDVPVSQVYSDHMGLSVSAKGKYKIKVDLYQAHKCQSEDGDIMLDIGHYQTSATGKWGGK